MVVLFHVGIKHNLARRLSVLLIRTQSIYCAGIHFGEHLRLSVIPMCAKNQTNEEKPCANSLKYHTDMTWKSLLRL